MIRLQIVGGGRMGEALLVGLMSRGWAAPADLRVVEPSAARRDELAGRHGGAEIVAEPGPADGSVLAVKPEIAPSVCERLTGVDAGRILSIAAGVTIETLEAALSPGTAVVRAMPNTPALVGAGAAAIAAGTHAGEEDLDWAEGVLGAVGIVARVPEAQLDAVTGLSGSGPAYLFLVAEALVEAGVNVGLPRDVAERLTTQTMHGAAMMLAAGDEQAPALRAAVTSPGGTTAAGLRVLEAAAVRSALIEAVASATERSRELGRS